MKRYAHIATCCAIFAIAISGGLSADTAQGSYQLPSDTQVIGYLLQSVNWYRHVYTERQVASNPADLVFLNDSQAIESQIVELSFEFAKADVALAKTATSQHDAPATVARPASADLTYFIKLKDRNDQVTQQSSADIGKLNEKIASARKADSKKLKAALDDAQSRLELSKAVSQAVNDLIQFVQTARTPQANTETLDLTIDDLAQSIPGLSNPATPLSKLSAQDPDSRASNSWRETGLLGLGSEVSALKHKLRVVDDKIRLTDNFLFSAKNIRTPMSGFITGILRKAATSNLQTSDLSLLHEQKAQLDALTFELKAFSPAIVALDKQKALLEEYESHLLPWRTTVASQYRQAWKKLVVRLLIVTLIVGLLFGMGEISRRLALRRIQDPNRRRVISMVYRLVTLFAIAVVALFSVASDLSSLATYFGLLTAGIAVALQNVILASLGYLVLMGKRGIRIGDRIQVSGITGDVIDMGMLQFQLREFDVEEERFTGHTATFSNSLVFVSPAIGLLKINSTLENAVKSTGSKSGKGPDLERRESAAAGPG
ncbi:MAG TPA: mechanosensitive ion channel family protein [Terriglobales bacterium]|nr:mechanosensitive ion channel family protein [Terriglobales bacterium]